MKIFSIDALPGRISLGKHTENNAREVRVDCSPWLAERPELKISAWVTPPGGDAAYPAVVHMDGNVLVWPITSSDTAVTGTGMVEFLGVTDYGCRQLSATTWTVVKGSTTCSTCDPPDPAKPWVDQILDAANRVAIATEHAASAAASAESAAQSAGQAAKSETSAERSAESAREDATSASASAAASAQSADRAEQAAQTRGYVFFEIDAAGRLIMTKTENVEELDFRLNNGRLEAVYG